MYASNLAPEETCKSCLDCQRTDYGGWPKELKDVPTMVLPTGLREKMLDRCAARDTPFDHAAEWPDLPTGDADSSTSEEEEEEEEKFALFAFDDDPRSAPSAEASSSSSSPLSLRARSGRSSSSMNSSSSKSSARAEKSDKKESSAATNHGKKKYNEVRGEYGDASPLHSSDFHSHTTNQELLPLTARLMNRMNDRSGRDPPPQPQKPSSQKPPVLGEPTGRV